MKKGMSLRVKLTIWFSAALVLVTALTFVIVLSLGWSSLQKNIRHTLIYTVEDNVDEVEFYDDLQGLWDDDDADHYIAYADGYLEIDDDFLDRVNGIYTALYGTDGVLLYGENPVWDATCGLSFEDGRLQDIDAPLGRYYVFDRALQGRGLDGLWLRGVISARQGMEPLSNVVQMSLIFMPLWVLVSVIGGVMLVARALRPIQRMSETASRINSGNDLQLRIPVGETADELGQLARTLNAMMDRLEQSFEAERQFVSDVSHELRTPMSVIRAQCEYSLETARAADEYRQALSVICRQNTHMTRMVSDMLELLRMEHSADHRDQTPVDMSELVDATVEDMAWIDDKGITLTHEIAPGIQVQGNATWLRRMLTNLIFNAFRYGKENGHVHVSLTRTDDHCTLRVRDDGIGIAPAHQEKIFHRFYQVSPARTGTSTGLGLAMVQQIAQFHGGAVQVESVLDVGSTFTVTLPCPPMTP